MKISGFTLVRNGNEFDYPYLESVRSLLPLVDELVINCGISNDGTEKSLRDWIQSLPPPEQSKICLFSSKWPLDDPEKKKSGVILSEQTNLALDRCSGDWCIYLQADEVLHEKDYPIILDDLKKADKKAEVDALVFQYTHFYGSYEVIQRTRSAYRREVRAIRRSSGARSIGDAQSFRLPDLSKLRAKLTKAHIYHYGWVRTPEAMRQKTFFMDSLYHGDPTQDQQATLTPHSGTNYRYKRFWGLWAFQGSHPCIMNPRIQSMGWHWDLKQSPWTWSLKDVKKMLLDSFEWLTGIRLFEYRSYVLVEKSTNRSIIES